MDSEKSEWISRIPPGIVAKVTLLRDFQAGEVIEIEFGGGGRLAREQKIRTPKDSVVIEKLDSN